MLFNINTLEWDDEILEELDIPKCMLPEPKPSSCIYGKADPIFGGEFQSQEQQETSRQHCLDRHALMQEKQRIHMEQDAFLLMNTGEKPIFKEWTGYNHCMGIDGKVNYALEGSIFVAGAAIQWLRDELRIIDSAPDSEYMAKK